VRLKVISLVDRLAETLWLIPGVAVAVAVALQLVLSEVDERLAPDLSRWFIFTGGAASARDFLGTIATGLLSMTVLAFSITMLVLQLAANQMSPRVMSTFLRDRRNQAILGLFISTYAYNLLTLREVRDDFVPGLTIWVAFLGAMTSIGAFVYYIHHVAQAIRPISVITRVGRDTREAIDRLYPERMAEEPRGVVADPVPPGAPPTAVYTWKGSSGVLTGIDEERLTDLCTETDCYVSVVPMIGDFVGEGAIVARAWASDPPDEDELLSLFGVNRERTLRQDAAFGFRQLVDVATRALSPGTNDPTTAVQVLDELHALLARLAERDIPSSTRVDERGRRCLHLPRPDWDAYVSLAIDEIRHYGRGSVQVLRRMRFLLEDLLERVSSERATILRIELRALDDAAGGSFEGRDRAVAAAPGAQGHGPL